MDGGWLPTTVGLPPPIKKHAQPKPQTEARQHNERGVTLVPGQLGSVRLDVKGDGSRSRPKELRLKFFAKNVKGTCEEEADVGRVGTEAVVSSSSPFWSSSFDATRSSRSRRQAPTTSAASKGLP